MLFREIVATTALAALGCGAHPPARVDALMAPWSGTDTPGAAVLVIRNGQIVHSRGYGMADLNEHRPITPGTSFLLASVTKQFTAMAVMILAEEGKLNYDDTLASFFPEFPAYALKITVRNLLNHTAGLPEYDTLLVKAGLVRKSDNGIARNLRADGFEPTVHDVLRILAAQKEPRFAAEEKYEYTTRAMCCSLLSSRSYRDKGLARSWNSGFSGRAV
jgi:CubicO group peptidase (beta-lactamase class C family)